MEEIRSALIVGAGAVGAAIASVMYDSDPGSVELCASGSRLARYARDGFVVNGKRYDFALADPDGPRHKDLVIVAVKNYDLASAIMEMRPFVGPETLVLSLLNGVTSEDELAKAFGGEKVPLAMILGIDALRRGNVVEFSQKGKIFFGDEINDPDNLSERVRRIAKFLSDHGIGFVVPRDMVHELWYKFMLNCGLNQWSAILRAPYRAFLENSHAAKLLSDTMREVTALANVCGIDLSESEIDRVFTTIATLDPEGKTSMLQDIDAGRRTEIDAFAGVVLTKCANLGLSAPLNSVLFEAIKALESLR
jgi:2-dehydropantoate 2-reductase